MIRRTATPAMFAKVASGGDWKGASHLQVIDRAVMDAIHGTGKNHLLVTMPPRHGKSEYCSKYLPCWFLGTFPRKQVLLTSYNGQFAETWGRKCRRLMEASGADLFGVEVSDDSSAASRWDLKGWYGGMQTAGVGGDITGKGGNLMICDDPIKNAKEAASRRARDDVWDWWTSTFYTRREPGALVVVIQTRWHEDDLAGRLLREEPHKWRHIDFKALDKGKALWPNRYSTKDLEAIRDSLGSYFWHALYQQSPLPEGGAVFRREWLTIVDALPSGGRLKSVRYCDKAGSSTDGDFSAFVLMVECDGIYYIADVVHGRWSPFERNEVMLQTAELDQSRGLRDHSLWIEQEPGNGGKESALISARELKAFGPRFEVPSVDKVLRSRHFAAQAEAGNVRVLRADWNAKLIDELVHFPHGEHDDMVDGCSGAFNKLVLKPKPPSGVGVVGVRSKYVGT